jgi:hypothetical protein
MTPLTHCIRVYSILIHTGKGGRGERGELTRDKVRGQCCGSGMFIPDPGS